MEIFQLVIHKLEQFIEHGGAFPTLCAGTHGYAIGYILVKKGKRNMKIRKIEDVNTFLETVDQCKGDVALTSQYGDKFNLKSKLTQYVAVAALLGDHGDELELWCTDKEDEARFLKMFKEHPEIV